MSDHATPEHHDVEPAGPARLDADEPSTPGWLTALGGALFLLVALFLLATAEEGEDATAAGAPDAALAPEAGHPPGDDPPSEE